MLPSFDASIDGARFLAGLSYLSWAVNGVQSGVQRWFLQHLHAAHDFLPPGASG